MSCSTRKKSALQREIKKKHLIPFMPDKSVRTTVKGANRNQLCRAISKGSENGSSFIFYEFQAGKGAAQLAGRNFRLTGHNYGTLAGFSRILKAFQERHPKRSAKEVKTTRDTVESKYTDVAKKIKFNAQKLSNTNLPQELEILIKTSNAKHKHISKLNFFVFVPGKYIYVFMKNDGKPVSDLVSTQIDHVKMRRQVFSAFKQLYKLGYIHIDLFPRNILKKNDDYFLIDFGRMRKVKKTDNVVEAFEKEYKV